MEHPVESVKIYLNIFGALMLLTALTVMAAFLDFGRFNTVIALGIAVTKSVLVILFFMHVRHTEHLIKVCAVAGFLWLGILFSITFSDYFTRHRPIVEGEQTWILESASQYQRDIEQRGHFKKH